MSSEELEEKYKNVLGDSDIIFIKSVMNVNYNPHPYTIGNAHVKAANENGRGGMLGEEVMKTVRCAHPHCQVPYEQHTSDRVMAVSLKRDVTNAEIDTEMKRLIAAGMEADGIDGFIMVETAEKFRVNEE